MFPDVAIPRRVLRAGVVATAFTVCVGALCDRHTFAPPAELTDPSRGVAAGIMQDMFEQVGVRHGRWAAGVCIR